jgi:hypothetical protein
MSMHDVLEVLDRGFAARGHGRTEMPPKPGIHPRPDCFIHAMPAWVQDDEAVTAKVLYERAVERGAGVRLPL